MTLTLLQILAPMLLGFLVFHVAIVTLSLLAQGGARLMAALRALVRT